MPPPSPLNPHQRHHVRATFQYIDRLLADLEATVAAPVSAFAKHLDDVTPAERRVLHDHVAAIRARMASVMKRHGIDPGTSPASMRQAIRTSLGFIEIALEEVKPQYMRGYGEIAPDAIPELNGLVAELQAIVSRLDAAFAPGQADIVDRAAQLAPGERGGAPGGMTVLARVIDRQSLVEFRPALLALLDSIERPDASGESVPAKVGALRRAIQGVLEARLARLAAPPASDADRTAVDNRLRAAAALFEDARRLCESLRNPPQRELTEALDFAAEKAIMALDYGHSMPGGVDGAVAAGVAKVAGDFADDVRRPLGVLAEQVRAALADAARIVGAEAGEPDAWGRLLREVPAFAAPDAHVDVRVPMRNLLGKSVAFSRVRGAIASQIGSRVEEAIRAHGLALHEWSLRVLGQIQRDFGARADVIRALMAGGGGGDRAAIEEDLKALEEDVRG